MPGTTALYTIIYSFTYNFRRLLDAENDTLTNTTPCMQCLKTVPPYLFKEVTTNFKALAKLMVVGRLVRNLHFVTPRANLFTLQNKGKTDYKLEINSTKSQ